MVQTSQKTMPALGREERRMSAYGCCILWMCPYEDDPEPLSCDECPYYDPEFFRKEAESGNSYQMAKA